MTCQGGNSNFECWIISFEFIASQKKLGTKKHCVIHKKIKSQCLKKLLSGDYFAAVSLFVVCCVLEKASQLTFLLPPQEAIARTKSAKPTNTVNFDFIFWCVNWLFEWVC